MIALIATLAIEALLLLLLLTMVGEKQPGVEDERLTVVDVATEEAAPETPEPEPAQAEERPAPRPEPEEVTPPQPVRPRPAPPLPAIIPTPQPLPQPAPARPPAPKRTYGPPDTGGNPALRDTEQVGTRPNGEPVYRAAWYREPTDDELRGYMSTAQGPGWGLIECRTAPDWRVEDCVALDEYPPGVLINRAVLAAAWQFKVRPPRVGGRSLVGSWVRIRIDYDLRRR